MQNLDFTSMMEKYPLLESRDVSFLNDFFNDEKTQEILTELDQERKKRIKFWGIVLIIWFSTSFPGLYLFGIRELAVNISFGFLMLIGYLLIGLIIFYFLFKKGKTIKGDLLPLFVKKINSNIEYSKSSELFSDTLSKLKSIGLLKKYDRVDIKEDSIKYLIGDEHDKSGKIANKKVEENHVNITITGMEIKTSEKRKRRTKNGTTTYYVTTNHCYIMKIDFKNPKYILKNSITLLEDINNNYFKKGVAVFGIQSIILGIPLGLLSSDEQGGGLGGIIIRYSLEHYPITLVILVGMYVSIWFIYSYIKGKNRVILENIEFEKEFDVYCKDQIESRKLLTPSFMYRLVDYVNKISRDRVYEMYFHKNIFYVKFNILRSSGKKNYMEISKWKNVFKNLEDYVEFYLELKNITALTKDLKLFYYDKGLMSSKVLK